MGVIELSCYFKFQKNNDNNVTKYHENILNNHIKKKFDFLIEIISFTMVDLIERMMNVWDLVLYLL